MSASPRIAEVLLRCRERLKRAKSGHLSNLIHRKTWMLRFGNHGVFKRWSVTMPANVGPIDRVARFAIGFVLLACAIPRGFGHTGWNWVGWIGVVPLLTAIFGFCPGYALFGVSTCPVRRAS